MQKYYTVTEEYGEKFFRVPKVFMTNPKYKKVKPLAKLAWAILRDRHDLSVKNQWIDESGRIYFIFGRNKLAEILDCDPKTATSIRDELQRYELLEIQEMGKGFTDRLYLLRPEVTMDDVYKIQKHEEQNQNPEEASNIKDLEGWRKNSSTHWGKNSPTTEGKLPLPLGEKSPPNDTDISETEKNKTDIKESIYLEQIKNMELGSLTKRILKTKIDRLILFNINLLEVEILFKTNNLDDKNFSKVLNNVLKTEVKSSFENLLQTSIDNYIESANKKKASMVIKPTRTELLPDWFDKEKRAEQTPKEPSLAEKKKDIEKMLKAIDG